MGIYEKLLNVQKELKVPKNQRNSFGGYNYRSCEDILENVKDLLVKNKLSLQLYDELVCVGEGTPITYTETYYDKDLKKENTRTVVVGGPRYYVKATARLLDIEDNSTMENTAYAREEENKKGMDGSQITGTASSYARKYALNGLLLIDDTKDADTDEYQKENGAGKTTKTTTKTTVKLATPNQVATIKKFYTGDNLKKLLDTNKIGTVEEMTYEKANALISKIKEKQEEKANG